MKFQKEHLLEIDENSEIEKEMFKKERLNEGNDFIKGIHNKDQKIMGQMKKMLQNLENGNRSNFDQKILLGLFEEYTSDSDEGEKANRSMNTEEEKKEFYSVSSPPPSRTRQFNEKKEKDEEYDISNLKNLYTNKDSMVYIGKGSTKILNHKTLPTEKKKYKLFKSANNNIMSEITDGKSLRESSKLKIKLKIPPKSTNILPKIKKNRFVKISEDEEVFEEEKSETEIEENKTEEIIEILPPKPSPYSFSSYEQKMMVSRFIERRKIEAEEEIEKEHKKELKKQERERKREEEIKRKR